MPALPSILGHREAIGTIQNAKIIKSKLLTFDLNFCLLNFDF